MHQMVDDHRLSGIDASAWKFGLVVAQFNQLITDGLLHGCQLALRQAHVRDEHITVVKVPGAFEIPFMAGKFLGQKDLSAIICLGAVIKGETPHFDFVAGQAARGIMDLNLLGKIPVIFGVITCNTLEQAHARSTHNQGNKGYEAAVAALEMLVTLDSL